MTGAQWITNATMFLSPVAPALAMGGAPLALPILRDLHGSCQRPRWTAKCARSAKSTQRVGARGRPIQWDISTGTVIDWSIVSVTPPSSLS
jgi:hypothetical protein